MRIGFFTDRYYPQVDGVAVSVDLFARELRKQGHEVFIFCPAGPEKIQNEADYIVRFRSFPSIWYEDYRDTFPFTPAILRKVHGYKLDVIHIHTPGLIGWLGVRIASEDNIPLVATHHTDIEQYIKVYRRVMAGLVASMFIAPPLIKSISYKQTLSSLKKPHRSIRGWNKQIVRDTFKAFYSLFEVVIAPSQKIFNLLNDYGIDTKKIVLPTGIDASETKLSTTYNPRLSFEIPDTAPLLLFVGRLGEEKNIQEIFRAMPRVLKRHPDTHLLVVGDGPYSETLNQLRKNLNLTDQIHMTGMLDRAKTFACFRAADVFVFPSTTDTQGLVINEAGYEYLPIIYVDQLISPIPKNNKTGIRADNTPTGLAKAIISILDNPEKITRYGKAAHQAAKTITIQRQAKKLQTIYSRLVKSN